MTSVPLYLGSMEFTISQRRCQGRFRYVCLWIILVMLPGYLNMYPMQADEITFTADPCPPVLDSCDEDSALMPDYTSCNKYYECINGTYVNKTCPPPDELFHQNNASCINYTLPQDCASCDGQDKYTDAPDVNTNQPEHDPCTVPEDACTENSTITDPFSCNTYYQCQGGEYVHQHCPDGWTYSPGDGHCQNYSSQCVRPCIPTPSPYNQFTQQDTTPSVTVMVTDHTDTTSTSANIDATLGPSDSPTTSYQSTQSTQTTASQSTESTESVVKFSSTEGQTTSDQSTDSTHIMSMSTETVATNSTEATAMSDTPIDTESTDITSTISDQSIASTRILSMSPETGVTNSTEGTTTSISPHTTEQSNFTDTVNSTLSLSMETSPLATSNPNTTEELYSASTPLLPNITSARTESPFSNISTVSDHSPESTASSTTSTQRPVSTTSLPLPSTETPSPATEKQRDGIEGPMIAAVVVPVMVAAGLLAMGIVLGVQHHMSVGAFSMGA